MLMKMWTFNLFIFVTIKISVLFICTKNSYQSMVKHFLHAWIYKLFRRDNLQLGKGLYWNHAVFLFSFIILHSSNWKIILNCNMFTSCGGIFVQLNYITCLWVEKIILSSNAHVIMQKDVRYWVKKITHNTFLIVSPFISRGCSWSL